MRTDSEQQTAWTPGPWRWEADARPSFGIDWLHGELIGGDGTDVLFASTEGDVIATRADAELVALAPEMAAAILEADDLHGMSGLPLGELAERLRKIRAAARR